MKRPYCLVGLPWASLLVIITRLIQLFSPNVVLNYYCLYFSTIIKPTCNTKSLANVFLFALPIAK